MIRYVSVFVLSLFAVRAWAQTSHTSQPSPPHQHSETVIDGAKNPELIPDSTAFRLWLVTVSSLPNATEQERTVQKAHLSRVSLRTPADHLALQVILTEFKSQYMALIDRYNETAVAALAHGLEPDQVLFLQQRDELVMATRAVIASRLSAEASSAITAHIQSEKRHMQLHTTKEAAQ